MDWTDRLGLVLKDRNKSEIARALGWEPWRVSQIVGRGAVPNVEDAVKLCQYLGLAVEEVWGEQAAERFPQAVKRLGIKAATADLAEAIALESVKAEIVADRGGERRGRPPGRGTTRKKG